MRAERLLGILLFLPVPIVLVLFTRQPLGVLPSLAIGIALMLTHPLYARPFALRRASRRCLWCGRNLDASENPTTAGNHEGRERLVGTAGPAAGQETGRSNLTAFTLVEPRGTTQWRACSPAHGSRTIATLGWAEAHSRFLRLGILGALAVFLILAVLAAFPRPWPLTEQDASAFFRLAVAIVVLPLGWLGPRRARRIEEESLRDPAAAPTLRGVRRAGQIRTPFPVHIQALIGTWAVVWLFRLVGIWWLVQGAAHFLSR